MRVEPEKITKRLYGNNGTRDSILFPAKDGIFDRHGFLKKDLQCFPSTATEIGKEFSIIEKISAEDFWYTEDEMPVRNGLEDFFTKPFPEFNNPLLMA
jgi:hypothetical protein